MLLETFTMKEYHAGMPEQLICCQERYDSKYPSAIKGYTHKKDRTRGKIATSLSEGVVTEIKELILQSVEYYKDDPNPARILRQLRDVSIIANVDPEDVGLASWELHTEGVTDNFGRFAYNYGKPPTSSASQKSPQPQSV